MVIQSNRRSDFKPYLYSYISGNFYGYIGTPTRMMDKYGLQLHVGDVVDVNDGILGTLSVVVENDYNEQFIAGLYCECGEDGTIDSRLNIELHEDFRSFDYMCNNVIPIRTFDDYIELMRGD